MLGSRWSRIPGVLALPWLLALSGCGSQAEPEEDARPNVILLVLDTLRADHLHGYGYGRETSPNLDALMAEGVRFDTAIASSSWSAPSHTSISTGVYAHDHRVLNFGQRIAPGIRPISALLKDSGWATGLFSTHFALHSSVERLDEGIDEKLVRKNEFDAEVLDAAADWALDQDGPFFLSMVLMGPHAPYDKYPPEDDQRHFTDMPPGGEKTYPFTEGVWIGEGGIPRSVQIEGEHRVGVYINRYDRGVRHTDALVGRFLERLREAGELENTLVVVTSDHGEGLGDHDCFAHELYLYDFLVRVPLILRWPGEVPPGQEWKAPVPSVDVLPTVLGLLGLDIPDFVSGRDLSAELRAGTPSTEPVLAFSSYRNRGYGRYMVRSERYKLILDAVQQNNEFYDLVADPEELDDLVGRLEPDSEAAQEYERLEEALFDYLSKHTSVGQHLVPVTLSSDVLEELRALGYVAPEGEGEGAKDGEGADGG